LAVPGRPADPANARAARGANVDAGRTARLRYDPFSRLMFFTVNVL
jgi:hypothetical protein